MLAIETAEIGCTLIALSVPGLKPLFSRRFDILGDTTVPTTYGSGTKILNTIGSIPSRKTRGVTRLGSENEISAKTMRGTRLGDSDISLVRGDAGDRDTIQIRRSLNIDSRSMAGSDIKLEMYPRNWEQKR